MDLKLNEGVYIMTDFIRMLFMAQMAFVNIGLLGSIKFQQKKDINISLHCLH